MSSKKGHLRKSQLIATALVTTDATRIVTALRGRNCLTILAYHRIADADSPEYPYYRPNVSATPEMFKRQMAYVAEHFNVIDLKTLAGFVHLGKPLPPYPLLITFDDGYLDNFEHAFPVLKAYNLPAVMSLVTGSMTDRGPLWWDECSYYFHHTRKQGVTLPLIGEYDLSSRAERNAVRDTFIERAKKMPPEWQQEMLRYLRDVLDVDYRDPKPQFMSWDQARQMAEGGITFQGHTVTHPILSQISIGQMYWEILQSTYEVQRELNQPPIAFTYPNGLPGDYNDETIEAVCEAGYGMAFTYTQGAILANDIKRYPYQLPRIHVGLRDTFEIFAMRISGAQPVNKHKVSKGA